MSVHICIPAWHGEAPPLSQDTQAPPSQPSVLRCESHAPEGSDAQTWVQICFLSVSARTLGWLILAPACQDFERQVRVNPGSLQLPRQGEPCVGCKRVVCTTQIPTLQPGIGARLAFPAMAPQRGLSAEGHSCPQEKKGSVSVPSVALLVGVLWHWESVSSHPLGAPPLSVK